MITTIKLTDSLVAVCSRCVKNLAALYFETYFNTRWLNSSSRSRFPSNAVGPINSARYFHSCGMSISSSSAFLNISSVLKRDHKEVIYMYVSQSFLIHNTSDLINYGSLQWHHFGLCLCIDFLCLLLNENMQWQYKYQGRFLGNSGGKGEIKS